MYKTANSWALFHSCRKHCHLVLMKDIASAERRAGSQDSDNGFTATTLKCHCLIKIIVSNSVNVTITGDVRIKVACPLTRMKFWHVVMGRPTRLVALTDMMRSPMLSSPQRSAGPPWRRLATMTVGRMEPQPDSTTASPKISPAALVMTT